MRDIAVFLSMLVFLPFALTSATVAYLLWGWTGLISIQDYTYGFMRGIPYNQIFALITLFLLLVRADPHKGKLEPNRTVIVFSLFFLQATVAVAFAYEGNPRTFEVYGNLVKALLFCFVMPLVLTQRWRIHAFIAVIALGLGFHGVIEGLKTIVSAGGHRIAGLPKFGDNNQLGLILLMSTPFIFYIFNYSKSKLVRYGALGGLVVNLAAVVGTQSRGGFIAMFALGVWLVLGSRRKLRSLMFAGVAMLAVLLLAPSAWWERMDTIKEAGSDSSFSTRVIAWKVSSAIALSNPITGGGFRAVQTPAVWEQFRYSDGLLGFVSTPESTSRAYAAHSIYFEVLGDMGFIGLFIFIAIFVNVFITRRHIHKLTAGHVDLIWLRDLADMIGAAMVAYVIGGAALSLAYFEIVYMLVMLMEVLRAYAASANVSGSKAI
jgi:probable O-glycosylation ligase (exosortase A-associated)